MPSQSGGSQAQYARPATQGHDPFAEGSTGGVASPGDGASSAATSGGGGWAMAATTGVPQQSGAGGGLAPAATQQQQQQPAATPASNWQQQQQQQGMQAMRYDGQQQHSYAPAGYAAGGMMPSQSYGGAVSYPPVRPSRCSLFPPLPILLSCAHHSHCCFRFLFPFPRSSSQRSGGGYGEQQQQQMQAGQTGGHKPRQHGGARHGGGRPNQYDRKDRAQGGYGGNAGRNQQSQQQQWGRQQE
jgi:hypothetical protein